MSETTWLKRAMAFLLNMQIIIVLLQSHSLNQRIKVIRHKVMEDNVRPLTPTLSTLLKGVEEI